MHIMSVATSPSGHAHGDSVKVLRVRQEATLQIQAHGCLARAGNGRLTKESPACEHSVKAACLYVVTQILAAQLLQLVPRHCEVFKESTLVRSIPA